MVDEPFLALDHVTRRFPNGVLALDRASLQAKAGELVAVVGPSGCGKTTALRLIAGLDHPDEGDIRIGGRSVLGLPPERRSVGLVFQNYALFPHMSVAENIAYGLRYAGVRGAEARRRVEELLALVGLEGFGGRRPSQLSAGQQQRVAIARALAPRPRVLLLDEPLSALDAALRRHLRLEIRRIQRQLGLTALYVTHDQEEALSISDRLVVMRDGRVEQAGPPQEVYRRPATEFVAVFVGNANRIPASVVAEATAPAAWWFVPEEELQPLDVPGELASTTEDAPARPSSLSFEGELIEVEYLGASLRLHLRVPWGQVRAIAPGDALEAYRARIGTTLRVGLRPGAQPGDARSSQPAPQIGSRAAPEV